MDSLHFLEIEVSQQKQIRLFPFFFSFLINMTTTILMAFTPIQSLASNTSGLLNLDIIHNNDEFKITKLEHNNWLQSGLAYTLVEPSSSIAGGQDIIRYESKTGIRKTLISAKQLIFHKDDSPARIDSYEFSQDGTRLLLFTNSKKTWRHSKSGDYWLIDLSNGNKKKIGGNAMAQSLYFAEISPTGLHVAYMYKHNIYVENLVSDTITQLTHDGSEFIVNGGFDWVNEEEFHLKSGLRWSSDGKFIAYWRLDMEGIGKFKLINNTHNIYPSITEQQYPKVGTNNSAIKAGVVNISNGKTIWFKFEGNSRNYYLPRMDWTDNSKKVLIQHLNRKQNTLTAYIGDPNTGLVTPIIKETDKAWLETVDDIKWFNDGKYFTWMSDRDGWKRVYIFSGQGNLLKVITPANEDVISISSINSKTGWMYYTASPKNATQSYLFRSKLDGTAIAQRITPDNQPGFHKYSISPNQQWAIHTYSRYNVPDTISIIELPNHTTTAVIVDNNKLKQRLAELPATPHTFFTVTLEDDTEIDAWMIKPIDFNSSKKYPIVFYVYAEPWGQTVLDKWDNRVFLWHTFLAQNGYIVASIDNRGTPAPKGREWRKSIYGKIGSLTSADQAAATSIIISRDYIDEKRVAIWGRSGGGSHTLNAMFRYPDLYHTGLAVAPVADQLLYDTIYQERYTGVLPDDMDNFIKGSPITYAHQLKGNLLIIHGTADDNVHYQGTEKLVNKLIENNLQFTVMPYPNRGHRVHEGKNTALHKRSTMFNYLKNHMPAGAITGQMKGPLKNN